MFAAVRLRFRMVDIRNKTLVFREVWYDETWSPENADLILFYHWNEPVQGASSTDVHSLEIDLQQPEEEIWRGFTASTRNQINRAGREGMTTDIWLQPAEAVIGEFLAFFRQFTSERSLGSDDPLWMHDYASQGALTLTRAQDKEGQTMVWHSYFRNAVWARQLQSASLYASENKEVRNAVARANRYLHWRDMTAFRETGIAHFDFGGWYNGQSDEKLLRINAFKEEFGGVKTHRYHSTMPVSLKGKMFLKARDVLRGDTELHRV